MWNDFQWAKKFCNPESPGPVPALDPSELLFSKTRYDQRRGEVRLYMSHFFLRYLNDIYQAFEGDLAMAIVLGEISHHNTTEVFSPEKASNETLSSIQNDSVLWTRMRGCNAYSISCATGIPRETVRRKIRELEKRGWIEEIPKEGVRITKACADHFGADYSLRFLNGLLQASRKIEELLAGGDEEAEANQKRPPIEVRPRAGVSKSIRLRKSQSKPGKNKA